MITKKDIMIMWYNYATGNEFYFDSALPEDLARSVEKMLCTTYDYFVNDLFY